MNRMGRKDQQIMRLKKANCHNCYKCVRACPVKAISIIGDQAQIEENLCIYCGKCYMVCPQDARDLAGDADRVKMMINSGEKVYVSISSGFSSYFGTSSLKAMGLVLKKLGFARIEETAIGANRVVAEYKKIIEERKMQNIVSTVCPATNFLIQKYYPKFVKWMMPVMTPLEAHAEMMRTAYGEDIRVVGIGPCIAYHKLADLAQDGTLIDAYVTYEELDEWMAEAQVEITEQEDPDTHHVSNYRGRYLDEDGGLFRALPTDIKYVYKTWEVNGAARASEMFATMDENVKNYFINISSCANNCLGGPIVRLKHRDTFESKDRWLTGIKDMAEKGMNPSEDAEVDVRREFYSMYNREPVPTEEEIEYFMHLIGRNTKEDQLDCSGCGYPTCRAKAVAVFHGMADPFMCIPHSREKAEAQSNLLFEYSPSGVVMMDMNLDIAEVNSVAEGILNAEASELKGRSMKDFIDSEFLEKSMLKEMKFIRDTLECPQIGKLLAVTFFKVERHDVVIIVMDDKTEEAEKYTQEMQMRKETLSLTQDVVEKQMRIAQEIASLLGETTAETKLAINKLKNIMTIDEDGWH